MAWTDAARRAAAEARRRHKRSFTKMKRLDGKYDYAYKANSGKVMLLSAAEYRAERRALLKKALQERALRLQERALRLQERAPFRVSTSQPGAPRLIMGSSARLRATLARNSRDNSRR